jgi:hypothetical protein
MKIEQSVFIQLEQPYLISRTKILEKDFSLLNQDDSPMDNHVLFSYQYEDPSTVFLES